METLLTLDTRLFLAINGITHTPYLDRIALALSGVGTAGFIWFVLGAVLFLKEEKRDHRFFIPFVTAGGLCFLLVELLLKYAVSRPRPDIFMGAIIVDRSASWFSFPSSHAAIAWAMAVVLSSYEPKYATFWVALAAAISISRIYLGVHYPLDVLVGGIFGVGIGMLSLWVSRRVAPGRYGKRSKSRR